VKLRTGLKNEATDFIENKGSGCPTVRNEATDWIDGGAGLQSCACPLCERQHEYVPIATRPSGSERKGGQNEGRSHYIDENKGQQKEVSGRSHYIDENKSTYDQITHYLHRKKDCYKPPISASRG